MLLRGGAVLVFQGLAWSCQTWRNQLDMTQFDELSDLLFIKTPPHQLAERLHVDEKSKTPYLLNVWQ